MKNDVQDFAATLKIRDIRLFIGSVGFFTLASRALTVVIGFQIYHLTNSTLALGWLGLVEAIPAISLVLVGGYVADHSNRQKILLITRTFSIICTLALAILSMQGHAVSVLGLYSIIFLAGIARAFADPANTAFEAQVVPRNLTVNAASWIGSIWIGCSFIGPAIIGFVYDAWGVVVAYFLIMISLCFSWICTKLIAPKPQTKPQHKEPMLKSIRLGWNFVWRHQPLRAAMALDLFAVFFGGAIALLPVYAKDILHVGAKGLGLLNAAPWIGSFIVMLLATRHPPITNAGRNLLISVFGFGISIIIFAFSKNFLLSIAALTLSGIFDGISMIIRRSMVRLLSPDDMRGRISSVNWIFVTSSNELGAFESGMVATWIGTIPCVAVGGVITMLVVVSTALWAPQLRQLRFDPMNLDKKATPG